MEQLYQIGATKPGGSPDVPGLPAFVKTVPTEPLSRLIDAFGRRLTYLRVSVTDRCNLRCVYCLPEDAEFPFGDRDFLSPDEIETLVGTLVRLGIRRVRLTGGEPLVRKDLLEIVRRIKALPGVEDLSLSTNGTELERLAPALAEAGLDRVNVSLDTLDPEEFARIARRGELKQVWRGVEAALEAGLQPVKLNTVLLADGKLEDIERLAELTLERPLAVRFIEMMPTSANRALRAGQLTCDTVRARLEARWGPLEEVTTDRPRTGPAQAFRFAGAQGEIGFITPLSHTFCADCNRLRLTARGELRLCLFDERNHPLRHLLGEPTPERALEGEILRVLKEKPAEHLLLQGNSGNLASFMSIGG
ncbi:MAG TPA: GTP 3',8-cyclase MoaA [Thermoanaerobaculia bacterium]|jgi:cyclic pyranopterin phosphate synthase|nr:GTP 3',8-cyclase MoaA [Thermoanaerobaculia bacterium]